MSRQHAAQRSAVARARAGDPQAFTVLIAHYDAGLRSLAYRLLGDRDRMDDALQEAYVRAFRALPGFTGTASIGTWLYRIAYNACIDELERARRPREVLVDEPPERAGGPPEMLERLSERDALAQALAELSPADRAAVLLVDAQGFDYASAGEILGVASGTIASRLNRARAALRQALLEQLEGVADK